MSRGKEETSTSQVRRKRGSSQESPTASSLVASMYVKELRSFCRVPDSISLELLNGPAFSTVGQANNGRILHPGAVHNWTSLPRFVVGEEIRTRHPGTSYTYSSECLSNYSGLQCA